MFLITAMLEWYQHLPERIDPVMVHVGGFSLYWYGLLYVLAFGVSCLVFWHFARRAPLTLTGEDMEELSLVLSIGMMIGARFGYVIGYNLPYYLQHPLAIVSPFHPETGVWTGIAGMSYYGGLVGIGLALVWFARKRRRSLRVLGDIVALAVPAGYVLGRLGNFLNGELFGRVTHKAWGMYFSAAPDGGALLRHPSQLYEAVGEGVFLFGFLWVLRRYVSFPGALAIWYVVGYGIIRFGLEFFREPDPQWGLVYGLTLNQWFSVVVAAGGLLLFLWLKSPKSDIMKR